MIFSNRWKTNCGEHGKWIEEWINCVENQFQYCYWRMGGGIVSLNLISVFIDIPERLLLVQVNQQLTRWPWWTASIMWKIRDGFNWKCAESFSVINVRVQIVNVSLLILQTTLKCKMAESLLVMIQLRYNKTIIYLYDMIDMVDMLNRDDAIATSHHANIFTLHSI